MKRYVLIAGVNGAGKSTLYNILTPLQNMPKINNDDIVRELGDWENPKNLLKAGKISVARIKKYFNQGISFNQETTLCGKSVLKNIRYAKELGYFVELHYVGVESVDIAKARIAYRVAHGGHGIAECDVERRFIESKIQLKLALPLCDMALLYDNTDKIRRFAIYESGNIRSLSKIQPEWYIKLEL